MLRKTFSAFLASTMLLTSLTSCATSPAQTASSTVDSTSSVSSPAPSGPKENTLPIANGDVELLAYVFFPTGARQVYKDLSEHPVQKVMMEQTGIKLKFMHPPENDDGTYFNTTIASGMLPDIIQNNFSTYPGGPEAAMQDGVLLNMNDLIAEYAPNYQRRIAQLDPKIQKRFVSDNGTILKFGTIIQPPYLEGRVHTGLLARKDLLDKFGLPAPITIEDYTHTLEIFKKNGVEIPLCMPKITDANWKNYSPFSSAFGVTHDGFFLKEGKVVYSRMQPEYKEYLTLLNDWYSKGYMSSDFVTQNPSDTHKTFQAGRAGIIIAGNWLTNNMNKIGQASNPEFFATGIPYMRKNKDDSLHLSQQMTSADARSWFVTTSCKNPVEAVRFIDYLYLEDTQVLTAMGPGTPEYPTYELIDGKYSFTTLIKDNPDYDLAIGRDRFTSNPFQIGWFEPMEKQQYGENQVASWNAWGLKNDQANLLSTTNTPTIDESRDLSRIMNTIDTYTSEIINKIIVGELPITEFDKMVEQVKNMEIDKAVAIHQAAHERFEAR